MSEAAGQHTLTPEEHTAMAKIAKEAASRHGELLTFVGVMVIRVGDDIATGLFTAGDEGITRPDGTMHPQIRELVADAIKRLERPADLERHEDGTARGTKMN